MSQTGNLLIIQLMWELCCCLHSGVVREKTRPLKKPTKTLWCIIKWLKIELSHRSGLYLSLKNALRELTCQQLLVFTCTLSTEWIEKHKMSVPGRNETCPVGMRDIQTWFCKKKTSPQFSSQKFIKHLCSEELQGKSSPACLPLRV